MMFCTAKANSTRQSQGLVNLQKMCLQIPGLCDEMCELIEELQAKDVYITNCRKEYIRHTAASKSPYSNVSQTKYGNILSLNTHFLQCSHQNCDHFDRWKENSHSVNAGDFVVRKVLCTQLFNRTW